jgi:CheY-like chemotaxis protein
MAKIVLLVEDSISMRKVVSAVLNGANYKIVESSRYCYWLYETTKHELE